MKKNLKIFMSIFLVSGFLVACADGEDNMEEPVTPDVPDEQVPDDGSDAETDEGM